MLLATAMTSSLGSDPANIVWIMADDLDNDWKDDRMTYMPALKKWFRDEGAFFENHVAAQPVCGPSRSSLLLGRYPHNTGYVANDDDNSVRQYVKEANKTTIGAWLHDAGYYTAFHGKYVNSCEAHVPTGWSHWGAFLNTYDFYNASCYVVEENTPGALNPLETVVSMTGIHQADFLGNFTLESVARARAQEKPFFIHVTPVMPHWGTCYGPQFAPGQGYAPTDPHWEFALPCTLPSGEEGECAMPISPCPSDRHKHAFDGEENKHVSGMWNLTASGSIPVAMQSHSLNGQLNAFQTERENIGWRNRSCALLDLDHMLNVIVSGLDELKLLESTYVIFTSDNGYHLGEHKLPFGKGQPYETDVRLPMYIRSPLNLPRWSNRTLPHPTTHLDIVATVVEIAGATRYLPQGYELDGKSFLAELAPSSSTAMMTVGESESESESDSTAAVALRAQQWRQFSFSEFFAFANTWQMVRVVNTTHRFTYHWWCTNDTEVFDLQNDPHQMANLAGVSTFGKDVAAIYRPIVHALGKCSGAACSTPSLSSMGGTKGSVVAKGVVAPLPCYTVITAKSFSPGSWNLLPQKLGVKVTSLHGWQVGLLRYGGPTGLTRGWPAVTVELHFDGVKKPALAPNQVANMSRTDLVPKNAPNPNHGFLYSLIDLLKPTLSDGKVHMVEMFFVGDPSVGGFEPHGSGHPIGNAKTGAKYSTAQCVKNGLSVDCKTATDDDVDVEM